MDIITSSPGFLQEHNLSEAGLAAFHNQVYHGDYDFLAGLAEPHSSQVTLIVLYTVTVLVVVGGNSVALVVLALGNRSKTDLTKYLINLAVSDLCMGVFCMPFTFTETMLGRWVFGRVMCPLVLFMQVTSVAVSIYTNVAIGIDRYLAVVMPLKQRVTKTRTRLVILIIWLLAMGLGAVQLVVARAQVRHYGSAQFLVCGELWQGYVDRNIYNFCMLGLNYVIPLGLLCWTYTWIGQVLWSRQSPGNADALRDRVQIESRRKVTKMLVVIVVMFAVCWLPLHLFIITIDLHPALASSFIKTRADEMIFLGIFYACHWLAMANSFSNPAIYCFLNDSFRADLRYLATHNACRGHGQCSCHRSIGRRVGVTTRSMRSLISRTLGGRQWSSTSHDDTTREDPMPEKRDKNAAGEESQCIMHHPQGMEMMIRAEEAHTL